MAKRTVRGGEFENGVRKVEAYVDAAQGGTVNDKRLVGPALNEQCKRSPAQAIGIDEREELGHVGVGSAKHDESHDKVRGHRTRRIGRAMGDTRSSILGFATPDRTPAPRWWHR